jgi:hypothetical protein
MTGIGPSAGHCPHRIQQTLNKRTQNLSVEWDTNSWPQRSQTPRGHCMGSIVLHVASISGAMLASSSQILRRSRVRWGHHISGWADAASGIQRREGGYPLHCRRGRPQRTRRCDLYNCGYAGPSYIRGRLNLGPAQILTLTKINW